MILALPFAARTARLPCALLLVAGGPHSSLVRLCVPVCVCKELAKYLELDQHPNSSIAGSEQLRKTSTCVIAKGSKKDRLHIVLRWRQLENQRLRRYVDSIERLEIFSFA